MLISELPDDLRALAEANHLKCPLKDVHPMKAGHLSFYFEWRESDEGRQFWRKVWQGRFDEARALLAQQKESK